jgi:hypothetical protein
LAFEEMSIKNDVYTIKIHTKVKTVVRNHLSRTSLSLPSTPDWQYFPAKVGQTFTVYLCILYTDKIFRRTRSATAQTANNATTTRRHCQQQASKTG